LSRKVGVSVYTPEEFEKALDIDAIGAIQVPMNVVDQRITDNHLNQAGSLGKQVFARSIFLQGVLLAEPDSLPPVLSELAPVLSRLRGIASDLGMTVMELLIASVRDRSGLSGLVIGAESTSQLNEIASACGTPILEELLSDSLRDLRVDNIALLDPRKWS
jgi:aryl-alcohol dehydrogenase-like predicted oxidoreductase